MVTYVDFVFERVEGDVGRLVAILNDAGEDVSSEQVGEWVEGEDGQPRLRVTVPPPPPRGPAREGVPRATTFRNPETGAELTIQPTGRTYFEVPTDEPACASAVDAVVIQLRRRNARQLKIVAEIPISAERVFAVVEALRAAVGLP